MFDDPSNIMFFTLPWNCTWIDMFVFEFDNMYMVFITSTSAKDEK